MDAAKASVKKVLSKSGHHDTTVHEKVAPAVTQENVSHTKHENVMSAVDREVHQDHYHTSVQPVHHQETLPEDHQHNAVPIEHRSFEHDNSDNVTRRLEEERAQFKDSQQHVEGERTSSHAPALTGEHKHHHVHETIQPVVNKQTIQPHVVHTTVPVHEVHHNETQHHAASSLPAVSMDDFKKQGGSLTGREERTDHFNDEPRLVAGGRGSQTKPDRGGMVGMDGNSTGVKGEMPADADRGYDNTSSRGYDNTSSSTSTGTKPSLMDKLNPKKDANGDGQPGFMK